ncbi:thioredoxin [Paenibacillus chitinolyticus]|uniref:Thioredoxin n=1 Tax=Paenibacillus chitinolyticus TaxID=79263 RepID=A0A410WUR3_9BACL|nr:MULTISPECIES: thioredoxin [Paenibacillus]MCY9591856.1 thioredoxin [Paenibacillus chitinolyticus]MCY9595156.1 thioredoxin [Paenibacillus chitinolyticus]QAV18017.1 thioredoxin [Paenibacillus chitinolyticus]GKS09027.1 thioredoxin [Paenibacillus chitinolyticus]
MSLLNVSDQTFQETLDKNNLVLVDFWAPWCGPCKMQSPILDQLTEEAGEAVTIAKINVDDNPETASKFGVMSIPTLKLFKNGSEVKTMVGVQSLQTLKELVNQNQ